MKEIETIIKAYNNIDLVHTKAALATVVRVEGSSYRRTGARMLVLDNGVYLGGISGGCLEGDALRRAQKAILQNKPSVITYDTTQDDGHEIGVGLGCNGIIDVLITPLYSSTENNPVQLLSSLVGTREPRIMVSIVDSKFNDEALGTTIIYENDEQFINSFPLKEIATDLLQDLKQSLQDKKSVTNTYDISGEVVKIFIEVILPATHLIVYGGGYDIYPLLNIAKELGWKTTVVMNIAKANKRVFESSDKVLDQKTASPLIDEHSAVVLMSHDYNTDLLNLKKTLDTSASYIGMLGPRKGSEKMFDAMAVNGSALSDAQRERIFSPAGLDIGAVSPEEIALSIVAEIRSHFARRNGMSLKLRRGAIYDDGN